MTHSAALFCHRRSGGRRGRERGEEVEDQEKKQIFLLEIEFSYPTNKSSSTSVAMISLSFFLFMFSGGAVSHIPLFSFTRQKKSGWVLVVGSGLLPCCWLRPLFEPLFCLSYNPSCHHSAAKPNISRRSAE
jgi:hypothetical protein